MCKKRGPENINKWRRYKKIIKKIFLSCIKFPGVNQF